MENNYTPRSLLSSVQGCAIFRRTQKSDWSFNPKNKVGKRKKNICVKIYSGPELELFTAPNGNKNYRLATA